MEWLWNANFGIIIFIFMTNMRKGDNSNRAIDTLLVRAVRTNWDESIIIKQGFDLHQDEKE